MKENIFTISKVEINRRVKAYTALIVSFFLSLIIFSFNYIASYIDISICIILIIGLSLFGTRIILIKYFNSISINKNILTPQYIIKNNNKYLIKNIKKIYTKRTTKGNIREIKIVFNDKTVTYINNSIDCMEEFARQLQHYLSKNVVNKNIKEPIDYDHFLFYPFLGILLGIISIQSIKFFLNLSIHQLQLIYCILSIFVIIMGLYFAIYRPIYKRDEKANQVSDYIWALLFIATGILIFFFYIVF
jgi:hypothetical protein